MSRPAIVLFDLGGVLLPFDPARRVRAVAQALAIDEAQAQVALCMDLFARMDRGSATCRDFAERFSDASDRKVGESEAQELILSVFEPPNEALWRLARGLQGRVVVGGFSDNPPFVRSVFPAGEHLDPMFWSAELGATKATDAAFATVEMRLNAPPCDILLIDDSASNVERALRQGWDAIAFTSNEALWPQLADRGLV